MEISVVIPAYNEAKVIRDTITAVRIFLAKKFSSWEIIVVDDHSDDSTLQILKQIPEIIILANNRNHGKGYSVAKGVAQARGEWILFMDADHSTRIEELEKFWPQRAHYQMIIASRALPQSEIAVSQKPIKVWLGRLGNKLIQLVLTPGISDTQCGFKLFSSQLKPLFRQMTITRWGFDFELIFLAKQSHCLVKEMPVRWTNNFNSRVTPRAYLQTLWQVFKVKNNYLNHKYQLN